MDTYKDPKCKRSVIRKSIKKQPVYTKYRISKAHADPENRIQAIQRAIAKYNGK